MRRWQQEGDVTKCWLKAPAEWRGSSLRVPVELLDSMFQTGLVAGREKGEEGRSLVLPFAIEEVTVRATELKESRGETLMTETRMEEDEEPTASWVWRWRCFGRTELEWRK